MKRIVWMLCLVIVGLTVQAQEVETSANDTICVQSKDAPIMKPDTVTLYIEAKKSVDSLTVANKELKSAIDALRADSLLKASQIAHAKEISSNLQKHILSVDTVLISWSSNYLYVPYDAYCVKEMAIPGFEKVYSRELREKYSVRLSLLRNYQSHIVSMVSFLKSIGAELKKPFVKSGEEFIESLKGQPFYMDYMRMDDYEDTYLGGKIKLVIQRLKQHGNSSKASFDDIIEDLENCLKTENDL